MICGLVVWSGVFGRSGAVVVLVVVLRSGSRSSSSCLAQKRAIWYFNINRFST